MIPLLVVAGPALAATFATTLGVSFTVSRTDAGFRPGIGVEFSTQVLPLAAGGQWTSLEFAAPSVGAAIHWRSRETRRRPWLFGVRTGVSWWSSQSGVFHIDEGSTEAEFGVAVGRQKQSFAYVGGHTTVLGFGGVGFDILLPDGEFPVSTGYLSAQLPIPPVFAIEGRPLRVGAGRAVPRVLHPATADQRWLRVGREELASVSTFLRLANELEALSAPRELVARSRIAAHEELGHAAMCFALAGGAAAALPPWSPRRFPTPDAARRTLGVEALVDGCGNENAAADAAERDRDSTPDERVARVQERIAIEERGHARLGADIARWCEV